MLCIALAVLFVLDFVWSAVHPNMGTGVTTPHGGMVVIDPAKLMELLHYLP